MYERGGEIVYSFFVAVDGYHKKLAGLVPDASGYGGSAVRSRYNLMYFA